MCKNYTNCAKVHVSSHRIIEHSDNSCKKYFRTRCFGKQLLMIRFCFINTSNGYVMVFFPKIFPGTTIYRQLTISFVIHINKTYEVIISKVIFFNV